MVKSIKTITLDAYLSELATQRGVNVSMICNEALKNYLEVDQDPEPKEIHRLQEEINKKEAQASALKTHLKILKDREEREARRNRVTVKG